MVVGAKQLGRRKGSLLGNESFAKEGKNTSLLEGGKRENRKRFGLQRGHKRQRDRPYAFIPVEKKRFRMRSN